MIAQKSSPYGYFPAPAARRRLLLLVVASTLIFLSFFCILVSTYNYELPSIKNLRKPWIKKITIVQCAKQQSILANLVQLPPQNKSDIPSCNPFLEYGYIDSSTRVWTPYQNSSCPGIAFNDLRHEFHHLRNQRHYFYGDSVVRNAVQDFCKHLSAPWETFPNPPGYLTTTDKQAIHSCHNTELNYTAINVYTFGVREWSASDVPFLSAHPSLNHRPDDDPKIWSFEDRMATPHEALLKEFGPATIAYLGTGLWDLFYLQRYLTDSATTPEGKQTEHPPPAFLVWYARRIREYIDLARLLHAPTIKATYLLTLHDPKFDMKPAWGMNGYPSESVKYSCTAEPRVRALREVQYAVVDSMKEEVKGVKALPFDRIIKTMTEGMKKMLDDIHPSGFANEFFAGAVVGAGREVDIWENGGESKAMDKMEENGENEGEGES